MEAVGSADAEKDLWVEVKTLLERDADVNQRDRLSKRVPLHEVAMKGHSLLAKLLVSHSVRLEVKDKEGATPLHMGCQWGSAEVVEVSECCRCHGIINAAIPRYCSKPALTLTHARASGN